jgi:ADP-ribose pyrophosphatase YjhB (NUDIX family)
VAEGRDSVKQQTFYRPPGGTIEFGEQGNETVVRELLEEIDAEVAEPRYIGTLENISTLEGQPEREIVLVCQGDFVDAFLIFARQASQLIAPLVGTGTIIERVWSAKA